MFKENLYTFFLPNITWSLSEVFEVFGIFFILISSKQLARFYLRSKEDLNWVQRHLSGLLFWFILTLSLLISVCFNFGFICLKTAWIMSTIWLFVELMTLQIKKGFWRNSVSFLSYLVTSFYLVLFIEHTVPFLNDLNISIGEGSSISLLLALKAIVVLGITIWMSIALSREIEARIDRSNKLPPSLRFLLIKVLRIILLIFSFMIGLNVLGVDLTVLALIGGGVGVGVGIGLQKIVSNLVSGFALLLDQSVKPGDVLEIENSYGWVNKLGARFVSIITRDETEILIPNEDFITQKVTNWSLSKNQVRLKVDVGVSYSCDPVQVKKIMLDAVEGLPRILKDPETKVLLMEFGDSSINLQMRIWINDPQNGISNIKSDVLFAIWEAFKLHQIEIPFPQRDLHIKQESPIRVSVDRTVGTEADA